MAGGGGCLTGAEIGVLQKTQKSLHYPHIHIIATEEGIEKNDNG